MAKIQTWISHCMQEHDCSINNDHFVPTRLLDIRSGIALKHMEGMEPVPYVALSHCWGEITTAKPMLLTKTSTIQERAKGIAMNM